VIRQTNSKHKFTSFCLPEQSWAETKYIKKQNKEREHILKYLLSKTKTKDKERETNKSIAIFISQTKTKGREQRLLYLFFENMCKHNNTTSLTIWV